MEQILRKEHAHDYGGLASDEEGKSDSDDDAGDDSVHFNEDEIQEATVPRPGSAQIVRREISPQQFDNDEDDNTLTHQERGF